ncbi:MAG TPA: 5'-nucleotidase C-terminal domain-containing protein [Burkholderiales bacterium]|nr:5'-nucleotidase C-terminal domain-containing protein [Burkholderiales bacterium]
MNKISALLRCASVAALLWGPGQLAAAGSGEITLIHMGDLHGHLVPRPGFRDGQSDQMLGGLARLYTKLQEIRAREKNTLLVNGGDTVQGSAEVLYTRGQAIVDVLNRFRIDAFNPGNWDFVYGSRRFVELFAGKAPRANWNAIAANLYYVTVEADPQTFFPGLAGQRVLPPYLIRQFGDLRVGVLGLTTDRGLPAVGRTVTRGFAFSRGEPELGEFIPLLRNVEKVDLLVVASELGLANNIRLAERYPGIDVILSSDMHEETRKPVVTRAGTVVVEEGQDGTMLGELNLRIRDGKLESWHWTAHTISDAIPEDPDIAEAVKQARASFVSGPAFVEHVNPFNGARLTRPIDTVVGNTKIALNRAGFSDSEMPAVIEGSAHDLLTDAFRAIAKADVAAIRGFRYGTHIRPGPIQLEDLYHFIPIGPEIGVVRIQGRWLKRQLENSAEGALDPNPSNWTGGWLFGFSGLTMDLDPYRAAGFRVSNIRVNGKPLDPETVYAYAGYWYADDPDDINGCECPKVPGTFIRLVRGENGEILDATEVVARYLQSLPDRTADPQLHRIRLLKPLPRPLYGFPELQPLHGAKPN